MTQWNRQEQWVIVLMAGLLLLGLGVKYYRTTHSATARTAQQN